MENKDIVVVASNAMQMKEAQASLISHFHEKLNGIKTEIDDAGQNIEIAKKRKWKTVPFVNLKRKLEKEFSFYEKIKTALEAGYVIIPNFNEIDIFAIRTTRNNPKRKIARGGSNWVQPPHSQESNTPSLGEGRYVNADTINDEWTETNKLANGSIQEQRVAMASDFDSIDFPFKFVKPEILERTSEAMEKLVFDDIGILPNRDIRRGDPMVIGRIWTKKGYQKKCASFLITWFVDTKAI